MHSDRLIHTGEHLVKRFGTRDPYEIADGLGIIVLERPDFGDLKGMYTIVKRNRFVFLNQDLDEDTKRIVLAHELGHDQLHRDLVRNGALKEFMLYNMKSKPEYEANIVCAEILLDSDEVLSYIYDNQYTAVEIARAMRSDINLVALKIAHLSSMGHALRTQDYHSNFLRK